MIDLALLDAAPQPRSSPWTFWTLCACTGLAAGMGWAIPDTFVLLIVAAFVAVLAAFVWVES